MLKASEELVSSILRKSELCPLPLYNLQYLLFFFQNFPPLVNTSEMAPKDHYRNLYMRYYAILLVVVSVSSLVLAAPICKGDIKWVKPRNCKPVDPDTPVCILTIFFDIAIMS